MSDDFKGAVLQKKSKEVIYSDLGRKKFKLKCLANFKNAIVYIKLFNQ